ncbi:hypothetical protein TNCV_4376381 [Trichonephila clavipes]|nr:hypothetical protein TNCV_4376381 [Trichonephila clavipes]
MVLEIKWAETNRAVEEQEIKGVETDRGGRRTRYQAESVPELEEIRNLIEEVVDFARQINLEVDSDDVQELLDSHNQKLTSS